MKNTFGKVNLNKIILYLLIVVFLVLALQYAMAFFNLRASCNNKEGLRNVKKRIRSLIRQKNIAKKKEKKAKRNEKKARRNERIAKTNERTAKNDKRIAVRQNEDTTKKLNTANNKLLDVQGIGAE